MTKVRRYFLLFFFLTAFLTTGHAQVTTMQRHTLTTGQRMQRHTLTTGQRTVISQHYTTKEGLPSNDVLCVLKDRDGFLWFGTWYGLCRFDGDKFLTFNKPLRAGSAIPPRKIESMVEDSLGHLWLKTADWKLYTFNRQTECFHAVLDELKKHTRNLQVIKIQRTDKGDILLLTKDKTLLLAHSDEKGIQMTKLFDPQGMTDPQTLQLTQDVKTQSHGYRIYIGRDYRIFIQPSNSQQSLEEAMDQEEADRQRLTEQWIQTLQQAGIDRYSQLYQDQDGLLWVTSTSKGVYCLNTPRQQFSLMPLPDDDQTGVRCLYQTRQGNIIVGARSRNVYIYGMDKQLQKAMNYKTDGIGAVYHAMEDSKGRLWLSTKGDGLVVDGKHYRHDPSNPKSLSGNNVYITFIDSKQHIWVGTLDGGLNLADERDGQLTFYNKQNGLKNYPAYGLYTEVRNIVEDKDGRLWIGTIDGLMSINNNFKSPSEIEFKTYRDQPEASFANNDIYTLFRDQTDQIWIGAFGGGLQKLGSGPLGPREGLRNDVIYSIVEDLRGHLWFATEGGLSCYNQQTGRIRNFDRHDGIPDIQIEEASAVCLSNGELWIGCKEGILTFKPDQLQTSKTDYRTFITQVMVDHQPIIGATAMPYTNEIELSHDQNSFSMEFVALNYLNHSQLNYRYKLEGYDRDWHYCGPQRSATYTEVPPGNYTFIVETIDDAIATPHSDHGAEIATPHSDHGAETPSLMSSAQMTVRILPPWWATWWAYLIYLCITGLIAWLVIRTILQMNRMRNEIYISQRLAKIISKPDEGDEFIDRLHRIIRKNIPNTEFNVDAIASEMGMSRSAFFKKVKSQTGFAPIDLIKEFRLSHATELLQTTNLSISEIAFRSGFADSSYFGKCFRKRYGLSPREYLKQEEEEKK